MLKSLDIDILNQLQEDARLSLSEIADRVGSSVPTVSDHVRKLEADGTIKEYATIISPLAAGLDVTAFIFVSMESSANYDSFRRNCRSRRDVLECHAITGTASHLVKVRVKNTAALEQLLSAIQQWKGVSGTLTSVVLSTHKETLTISLPPGQ